MCLQEAVGDGAVVPAISHPSSLACARSLHDKGFKTVLVSEDESAEAYCSRYCDESQVVPSPTRDMVAYKDALIEHASCPDIRTILPVREKDVYVLSKYRDEFADDIGTPWPDFDTVRHVQDRIRLYRAANTVDVPTPETHLLTDCPDWSKPWIVKGRYSVLPGENRSDGSVTLNRPPTTRYLSGGKRPDVDSTVADMGHVPIVQEYLQSTDEYGFFAIYDHGEALATFQHRQVRGTHYSGGASAFRQSVSIPELETLGTRLLDHLDWHGVAMVEFKQDETGEFKLMEINPRFWSSLPFTVQAGADFPHYAWLLANGEQDRIDCQYDVDSAGHLLAGEASHLLSILTDDIPLVERPSFAATAVEVAASLIRHPRFDYLDVMDPCPFTRHAWKRITGLVNRFVQTDESSDPNQLRHRSQLKMNKNET